MPLAAGTKLGPYEILAPLGAGGMGEVYRARDTKLDRDIAIKVLPAALAQHPDRLARFEREAKVLAALNHPSIAAIYGLEDGVIVMELVEGPTLADRLHAGALPVKEALTIAREVAEALEAAHEKGVIHRDLKPANIKAPPDGPVKVLDFGLATAVQGGERDSANSINSPTLTMGGTEIGVILGTASYMSPEQASGKRVDKRADIWSFGVLLWEMLTGKRLFDGGETVSHTLADVLRAEIDFGKLPRSTPATIRELLKRCLDRDLKTRLRDIGEARIAIQKYLADPATGTEVPIQAEARPTKGHKILWAWAAFATLLALVVGFLFFRQAPPVERSLRYTIAAPENGAVHSFAISPDGRHLAIAASANGRQQLWLRALDALQAQPMPGTDEAMYPFWSPDNRYIGFFAQGKLKKVAASGGPAQSLCNAPAGLGGAWNSEDVIVFSPDANGVALQRVSAAGGVPADVTKTKGSYRFPRFLPGGRRFLYSVAIDTADKDGVFVGSLDGNENRRILADVTSAQFAPSASGGRVGHILFVRDNTLMALPFDAASAQTSGDAFPVAEGISTANRYWAPVTVSEDGVMLYAIRGGAGGSNQIVWFDRAGKLLGPVGDPGVVLMPSISPDEKMIAYTRLGAGGVADIWLRNLVRGNDVRFTSDGSRHFSAVWSPKGDRIVYTSVRSGPPNLFRRAVNGSGPDEPLLPGTTANSEQWSRDGRFIVYRGTDPQTKQDIWVLPVDDHAQPEGKPMAFLHSDFNELQGQLSPDSRWMAYTSDESGQREVYVRPFSAAQGLWRISTAGGDQPRWRGDTRELFFAGADGKMMAVAVNAAPSSNGSAKRSIESGPPVPLFESHIVTASNNSSQYDVTADGKRFLVVTNNAATGALPPLTVWVNWLAGLKR